MSIPMRQSAWRISKSPSVALSRWKMSDDDWVELAALVLMAVLLVVVWRAFVGA